MKFASSEMLFSVQAFKSKAVLSLTICQSQTIRHTCHLFSCLILTASLSAAESVAYYDKIMALSQSQLPRNE